MSDYSKPKTYKEALEQAARPVALNTSPGPEYADDKRLFQGIVSIERAPQGRLWAVWYSGGQGEGCLNYVVLATSSDGGDNWSGPILVIDPPGAVRAAEPNLWLDPNNRLWLFWNQVHTLHDGRWGNWAVYTDDPDSDSPAWSEPKRLSDGTMWNKPLVLSNGEWLYPVSMPCSPMLGNEKRMMPKYLHNNILEMMTEQEVKDVDARHGACAFISTDNGQSIHRRGEANSPMKSFTHNEHMFVELKDGHLLMFVRTNYGIGRSESTDFGKTWSDVVPTGLAHPSSRFYLRTLPSGNILLVKHLPNDEKPNLDAPKPYLRERLMAFVSKDDARTWEGGLMLEPGQCSYPDGTIMPDGTIHVVYDHGRRTMKELRLATFTEEDVLAGKLVSPGASLRRLVNKATGVIPADDDWSEIRNREAIRDKEKNVEKLIFEGI